MAGREWEKFIPEDVTRLYHDVGMFQRLGFGQRPAVLLVDPIYASVGDTPKQVLESVKEYASSCGESGWVAIPSFQELLRAARAKSVPIIYAVIRREPTDVELFLAKQSTSMMRGASAGSKGSEIIAELAPQKGDIIVAKKRSSAFFGTPLLSYLTRLGIDTLIIGGGAASSCVFNTVVSAIHYNYRPILVEECVFDRHPFSRAIAFLEIDSKWGDVVTLGEVKKYLAALPNQKG